MADKRRLQESFRRAATKTRRTLGGVFLGAALLSGCSSTPARMEGDVENAILGHKPVAVTAFQQNLEGRSLTADTEAIFKRNVKTPVNENLPEDKRIRAYIDQLCFTPQSTPKPEQEAVREALQELAKLPLTGRPLVELAMRENMQFCNIPTMPLGTGAQYVPSLVAVLAPPDGEKLQLRQTIAHEILHGAQDKHGLLNYQYTWDIESRLTRNLSIEAAALSMEILIAFEAKQMGNPAHWDHMQKRYGPQSVYGDPAVYKSADETWAKAKAEGKDDAAALRAVGGVIWNKMFDNRAWLDFYLNFELQTYLRDITNGALDNQTEIHGKAYAQALTDKAGKTGSDNSFTEGARVPALDKLLEGNTAMRQAYAAADLERHRRSLGADHPKTQALKRAAEADNNPYIALDLAKIVEKSRAHTFADENGKRKFSFLHEYMDAAAGRPRVQTATSAPSIAPAAHPPAPPEAKGTEVAAPGKPAAPSEQAAPDKQTDTPDTAQPVPPRDTLAVTRPAPQPARRAA